MSGEAEVFHREDQVLRSLQGNDTSLNDQEMATVYGELLDQAKLITKVSDRLQNKLNAANAVLEQRNVQLQETVDALVRARVNRRATTIVLMVAVALFLISEAFLEPAIEARFNNFYVGLVSKGLLMLSLKPIDFLVERHLMKRALQQRKQVSEASGQQDSAA